MGENRSTRVDFVASTAALEDPVEWLQSVGFVEIPVPLEAVNPAPAQSAPSKAVAPSVPRRTNRRALALGALAIATISGGASARWVAPMLDPGSSTLAVAFSAATTCALAGAWFGARSLRMN